jgi:hypothetical protein
VITLWSAGRSNAAVLISPNFYILWSKQYLHWAAEFAVTADGAAISWTLLENAPFVWITLERRECTCANIIRMFARQSRIGSRQRTSELPSFGYEAWWVFEWHLLYKVFA